jgi:CheY-like chemotaxis protein
MCTATLCLFYTLALAHLRQRRRLAGASKQGEKKEEETKVRNLALARAHCDIRSSLTAIIGYCDLPAESPTPVHERFDSIRRQASQITGSINEVLKTPEGSDQALPPSELRMEALPQPPEPAPAPAETPSGPRFCGRVLLAEDNSDLQQVIKFYLQSVGAEVTIVADGEKACEQALVAWKQGQTYDLILMDVQMPKSDGRAATIFLRDAGYTEPIVALTANATDQERGRCFAAGCNGFLTKPVEQEEFLRTMMRYLKPVGAEAKVEEPIVSSAEAEFATLRQSFELEIPARIADISAAVSAENFTKVADLAHQFKGTAGCFGFSEIYAAAGALQDAAEKPENASEKVPEYFAMLARQIDMPTAKAA